MSIFTDVDKEVQEAIGKEAAGLGYVWKALGSEHKYQIMKIEVSNTFSDILYGDTPLASTGRLLQTLALSAFYGLASFHTRAYNGIKNLVEKVKPKKEQGFLQSTAGKVSKRFNKATSTAKKLPGLAVVEAYKDYSTQKRTTQLTAYDDKRAAKAGDLQKATRRKASSDRTQALREKHLGPSNQKGGPR